MTIAELVVAIICFLIAGGCAFLSARQFAEKGFLFNNAFIYATREARAKMDKKPYYRQSAIVFLLLSAVFVILGLSVLLQNRKLQLLELPLLIGVLVYAIISTIRIEGRKKES